MEPITPPPSLPRAVRPTIQIRGRDPAPKSRAAHPRPAPIVIDPSPSSSSSSSSVSSLFRAESPELMFPMSPVLSDEKELDSLLAPRHISYPIIVNLESAIPQLRVCMTGAALATERAANEKENNRPNIRRHKFQKPEPLIVTAPPKKTKVSRSRSRRHLASFLHSPNPTTPSVMESPTAVTVHRSSQPDGHSSFVIKEHTSLPPSPSRPLKILVSPQHHPARTLSDSIPQIEKAMRGHKTQLSSGGEPFHLDVLLKKMKKAQQQPQK